MSFREGRGRPRSRDYPSRSEEKSYHGRGSKPSRHLWVGNLPQDLTESDVAHHFLHFGQLESVAFQPGRSYAFINYRNEEDAFDAMKELQGFSIEGNPLRIEFTKAEKALASSRNVYSERRDNPHPRGRGSPFSTRDSRMRRPSPELSHPSKSKMNDKDSEPSEVLWIGFPAQLKVDEFVLRKTFSPFGDIEKITSFPGRTYAFVRFRDVMAACRAKENLQGKLFGNPRVHICFAKSDSGTSNRERNSMNAPPSPHSEAYGRTEYYDDFQSDRNFGRMSVDPSIRSPPYSPNMDRGDRNMRNANFWPGRNDIHERRRFPGPGDDIYDHPDSPPRNLGVRIREFSPKGFPRQGPMYDDPWDLPENVSFVHGTKKLKIDTFPSDNELPEYPLSDLEKSKRIPSRKIPQSGHLDNNYDSRHSGYRPYPERLMNTSQPFVERGDRWNAPQDDFQVAPMPTPPIDRRKLAPELRESSSKEVWRWEGMIAKGGTTVCRARCFPVGKPPEMVLPEILDCTARTSLDMLAKHYYQAGSAWVVFLAPADDPDISYYNEFMSYLGEKQRAAVVKLDERSTLFLVPPSEFSEKVLKVPGKMSISGVVLRLDPPGSSYGSLPQNENREASFTSFQNDSVYQIPVSPSGPYLPPPPPPPFNSYENQGNMRSVDAQGHDYVRKPAVGANRSPHDLQNSNQNDSVYQNPVSPSVPYLPPPPPFNSYENPGNTRSVDAQGHDYVRKPAAGANRSPHDLQNSNPPTGHPYSAAPRAMQEATHNNYTPNTGNNKWQALENHHIPSSMPVAALQADQLAQLTSSYLGQQGQFSGTSSSGEYKPSGNINQPGYPYRMPQNYGPSNDQMPSDSPAPQFGQARHTPNLVASQREGQTNQQLQSSEQDDPNADPQKRLEATLQLAAVLLQQIQQGKGT